MYNTKLETNNPIRCNDFTVHHKYSVSLNFKFYFNGVTQPICIFSGSNRTWNDFTLHLTKLYKFSEKVLVLIHLSVSLLVMLQSTGTETSMI